MCKPIEVEITYPDWLNFVLGVPAVLGPPSQRLGIEKKLPLTVITNISYYYSVL